MITQQKNDVFGDIGVILVELMRSIESTEKIDVKPSNKNSRGNWTAGDIKNAIDAMKRKSAFQFW